MKSLKTAGVLAVLACASIAAAQTPAARESDIPVVVATGEAVVKRAPDRVVVAVPSQPVGWNKAHPTYMYDLSMKSWAPELMKRDPKVTPDMILAKIVPNVPAPRLITEERTA